MLAPLEIAYARYGDPSHPVVYICHALTGDAEAAVWWDTLIGPGQGGRHRPLPRGLREPARRVQGDDRAVVDRTPRPASPTGWTSRCSPSATWPRCTARCCASLGIARVLRRGRRLARRHADPAVGARPSGRDRARRAGVRDGAPDAPRTSRSRRSPGTRSSPTTRWTSRA